MTLEIREADLNDAADAAGIVAVLDSYAADPVGGGRPLDPGVRERLVPVLRSHPTTLVLLALEDNRPVGVAVCFFGVSTFHAAPLLNIHDLAVLPGHRRRGIGRSLLAEAEKRAVARDCCRLTLEVQDDNLAARSLYERFGFGEANPSSRTHRSRNSRRPRTRCGARSTAERQRMLMGNRRPADGGPVGTTQPADSVELG